MAQSANSKPAQQRKKGRFASGYDNRGLFAAVAKVLKANDIADDKYVSTRSFDDLAAKTENMEALPPARQIATRLKRSWPDVVKIARQKHGTPSVDRAVVATTRQVEDRTLDERHIVFALNSAARFLGLDLSTETVGGPDYERAREAMLDRARGDGTFAFWSASLPSIAQIETLAEGDWDLALAIAGLPLRDGVSLNASGEATVKKLQGARQQVTVRPVEERRKEPVTKREIRGTRTGKKKDADREPKTVGRPLSSGRRKTPPMSLDWAIAEFVRSQGSWPSGKQAVQDWADHHRLSLPRLNGVDFTDSCQKAGQRLAADGVTLPDIENIVKPKQVNFEAPVTERLPKRTAKSYTHAMCLKAMIDCMNEKELYRDLGSRAYRTWAVGVPGRPDQGAFDKHGGWEAIKNEALDQLGK